MIGYAPLEPLEAPAIFKKPVAQLKPSKFEDTTECNYLVMFFVVGVLGLALKDMTRR